ncbi:PREDICTED: endoplasmic reticulum lectin 1 isoform X2 [Papilio polytes]|uniref:endoplasmic reticulum lectin 1 isoform X2 n=1 Tax=Papilio polytes TaxID=76194 RepID=UPI000675E364|nr:PREDICTED: endoplasmic reticulum lectin 1 isoform X2 [Papilio polytes]
MKSVWFLVLSALAVGYCIEHDFKGFDDSILFGINWPGEKDGLYETIDKANKPKVKEVIQVMTSEKEKYECHLPEVQSNEAMDIAEYDGPSPISLLNPLFTQKVCSFRLDSYWSYEICHGRYIKQYHEERDGKEVRTQEFYLGIWSLENQMKLVADLKLAKENKVPLKTTKVERMDLPCVELVMDGGTLCDLNDKPRITRVLYVCYSHGKHEVYSFKETATCEYEIIILSPLLCEHPQFKPKDVSENEINCYPLMGAPKKPADLMKMEFDDMKFRYDTLKISNKDGETHLKFELHPLSEDELSSEGKAAHEAQAQAQAQLAADRPTVMDDSPVRAFLNGENCLIGGTGWWKYEFCYGEHVIQYHVDRTGEKTTLLLGKFNEEAHLEWIKENRGKAPKPVDVRTSVTHFYSGGDVCDKTDKPRQTEVKLKCLENSSSPAQVSLYLLEPRTCHYILGVESPIICDILPFADENGLIKSTKIKSEEPKVKETNKVSEDSDVKDKVVDKFGYD